MELEAGSTPENPRVGMWAKAYMTTVDYTYLGTLMSRQSLDSVVAARLPPAQAWDVSGQKSNQEAKVIEKLEAAACVPYQKHFSAERLADALAMCRRQWQHFGNSPGKLRAHERWLLGEWAEQMRKDGRPASDCARLEVGLRPT